MPSLSDNCQSESLERPPIQINVMPRSADNLTPKQEAFVRAYIELGDASAAYRKAYNTSNMTSKSVNEVACRMTTGHEGIASRIAQERERLSKRTEITLDEIVGNIRGAIASNGAKASDVIAGSMALAKLGNLVVDRQETTVKTPDSADRKPDVAGIIQSAGIPNVVPLPLKKSAG